MRVGPPFVKFIIEPEASNTSMASSLHSASSAKLSAGAHMMVTKAMAAAQQVWREFKNKARYLGSCATARHLLRTIQIGGQIAMGPIFRGYFAGPVSIGKPLPSMPHSAHEPS